MDKIDWQELRGLFDMVCDLPPQQWRPELERTTGDPDLVERVMSLLEAQTLPMREAGASVARVLSQAADTEVRVGDTLGPWRLVERIGAGGMGTVFLAERADGLYEQRVAVKLLHGLCDPAVARRLAEERRILAGLQHPNIARLCDGGTTPAGHPYLVMDHVQGQRLDEYCATHRPGLAARLRLFASICRAVQAAHARLVVHCDLKPGNVIVNGDGEPVLLDFGIARVLGTTGEGDRGRYCTPGYASPEMLQGGVVDVASDVYSLGVMFVELVADRRLGRDAADAGQAVPAPSRWAGPDCGWRRRLRGDLDAIAARACAPDPALRYGSVEAMADDIERHRARLPVRARGGSRLYRAGRLLLRNRTEAAAATLVVALTLGFVAWLLQANTQAREQEAVATQVTEFLVSTFQAANPRQRGMDEAEVSAREVLDAAALRIESELADAPAQLATLRMALGLAYQNMGAASQAEALLRQAAEGMLDPRVDRPVEAAAALSALSVELGNDRRGEEALEAAQRALALLAGRGLEGPRADALNSLGLALMRLQRHDESGAAFAESLALRERLPPEATRGGVVSVKQNMALLHSAKGEHARAEELLREVLALKRAEGRSKSEYSNSLQALGTAVVQQGRLEEAAGLLRENLDLAYEVYGERSTRTADAHNELASVYQDLDRYALSAEHYARALELIGGMQGAPGMSHAVFTNNFATLQESRGDLGDAERLYRESWAIRRDVIGPDGGSSLRAESNLGRLLMRMGRLDEARPLLERPIEVWSRTLAPDAPDMLISRLGLAEWHLRAGGFERARALLEEVVPESGWTSPRLELRHQALLAELAQRTGDRAGAVEQWRAVIEARSARSGPGAVSTAKARVWLAESLLAEGDVAGARAELVLAEPAIREALLPGSEFPRRLDVALDALAGAADAVARR